MSLTQTQIIQSLGEALTWFEKEIGWGVKPQELSHLTGRIGELYVAMITRGQMAPENNQRGYDVISGDNELISVKTITSSHQVTFNKNTIDQFDRVIILRLNFNPDIEIEEILDVSKKELLEKHVNPLSLRFLLSKNKKGQLRAAHELPVIDRVVFESFEITRHENGSIIVWKNGKPLDVAKTHLREIAAKIGIDLENENGGLLNTRTLGKHVIRKIKTFEQS